MLNKLRLFFASSLFILMLATPSAPAAAAFDFFKDSCRDNANVSTSDSPICQQNKEAKASDNPIIDTIRTATNILAVLTGVAAVFMIILGAFNLIISGGSSEMVEKGRKRIIYSLVGIVVAALAWTITRFITDRVLQ